MTNYANIPTTYEGINFRSRLEAKYAVMFDLLGWRWEYEPIDFNGWIPDFVIHGVHPIYVEVKPILEFNNDNALGEKITNVLGLRRNRDPLSVSCRALNPHEALICGACLSKNDFSGLPGLGWLWDGYWSQACVFELHGDYRNRDITRHGYRLCQDAQSYWDRITGTYDHNGSHLGPFVNLERMWRQASNTVQWRAPR